MALCNRLGYLCNHFPALTATFVYREVFELNRLGIEVKTYSLRRPEVPKLSDESKPFLASTFYLLPVRPSTLVWAHLKSMVGSPGRYFAALFKMVAPSHNSLKDRFRSLMHFGEGVVLSHRMKIDGIGHIHAHFASQSTSVARVVHLLTGIPYSFTAHAYDIWRDRLLIPQKVGEARFVATCSGMGRQELMRQLDAALHDRIHVVYHGLDTQRFVPPGSSDGRTRNHLLSIGRLVGQKGFPWLIDACAQLKQEGIDVTCTIIGEGELRGELTRRIDEHGLSDSIRLVGMVPQERILQFYYSAWAFVLPCIDTDDGNRDGIPNVLMEAMACGLPAVTTTNSGQTELIEDGVEGLLVPPRDSVALARALRRVCTDTKLRATIQDRARRRMVNDFDSRKTTLELIGLFRRHCPAVIGEAGGGLAGMESDRVDRTSAMGPRT